jgi:hypothetical protein
MDLGIDHTLEDLMRASARAESGATDGTWKLTGLPPHLYHSALEWQSASTLKGFLDSPAAYLQRLLTPSRSTPAQRLGSLIHTLVLEPPQFPLHYEVVTDSKGAASADSAGARERVTEVQLHQARHIADRVLQREVLGKPLATLVHEGTAEDSIFFAEPKTGARCRIRPDLRHGDALVDLKTTRHASVREFQRAALDLHYDLQAYMYCLGDCQFEGKDVAKPFIFVVAQTLPPFSVFVLRAGESFLENGRAKYERAIALLLACGEVDYWPDQSTDGVIEVEHWQAFRPA